MYGVPQRNLASEVCWRRSLPQRPELLFPPTPALSLLSSEVPFLDLPRDPIGLGACAACNKMATALQENGVKAWISIGNLVDQIIERSLDIYYSSSLALELGDRDDLYR